MAEAATDTALFSLNTPILDDEVAEVETLVGSEIRLPSRFNTVPSPDTIRHFAQGIGDANPLWNDLEYGRAAGGGLMSVPPTFYYSIFPPGIGPGFPGLQGFHGGSRWEFNRAAREGEEVFARAWFTGLEDRQGKRSGRLLVQHGRAEYRNAEGELLAVNLSRQLRKPRPATRSDDALQVTSEPYTLTDDQLEALEDELLAYQRRGPEPRYWEDVTVGDRLDARIKGPLVQADMIAFAIGIGSVMNGETALRDRRAVAAHPETAPNHRSIGWQLERTPPGAGHMDPTVARAVGMPGVYDNGWLRVCWMGQVATDWMGDTGTIRTLETRLRLPNIVGDVLRINGEVVGKRQEGSEALADLRFSAARQDSEISIFADATVALPTRTQ